jgi:hypothetical protein
MTMVSVGNTDTYYTINPASITYIERPRQKQYDTDWTVTIRFVGGDMLEIAYGDEQAAMAAVGHIQNGDRA